MSHNPGTWAKRQRPLYSPLGPVTNLWQGSFPESNTAEDGFVGTAPADAFPANAFGLHGAAGNVWEWVADWYQADAYAGGDVTNPTGPVAGTLRLLRGGSWVTHDALQLRCSHRHKVPPDTYAYSIGFRVACSDTPDISDASTDEEARQ